MDFKNEVLKLVNKIPKGNITTPNILAESLGDPGVKSAVIKVLNHNLKISYKIVTSKIVNDVKQRKLLMNEGIKFEGKKIKNFHRITFKGFSSTYPLKRLREEQKRLSLKIIQSDDFEKIERICGIDVAYDDDIAYSTLIVYDFESMELLELKTGITKVSFPYIPTYLAHREFNAVKKLVKTLNKDKDLLLVDASGILHPRKLGFASYIGIKFNLITIGITKALLCGELKEKPNRIGGSSEIIYNNEIRGYALKSSKSKKLIYISPGNRISLKTALEAVKEVTFKRIPEPLRIAHINAKKLKLANTLKE